MAKQFPDFFPVDCPPKEAEARELEVYRFCNNSQPQSDDFLSYIRLYPQRNKRLKDNIKAYGLSVFGDYRDVK